MPRKKSAGNSSRSRRVRPALKSRRNCREFAKVADKCAFIRSVVGQRDEHSSFQSLTGYRMGEVQRDRIPNFGSVVARVKGPTNPVTPPFVDLFPTMKHRPYNSTGAGYLGSRFNQVRADGENLASMKLRYVPRPRFQSRQSLLSNLDRFRRAADRNGLQDVDQNYQRAVRRADVVPPGQRNGCDEGRSETAWPVTGRDRRSISETAPRYGTTNCWSPGGWWKPGWRVVTVAYGFWDTHGNNFGHLKRHLPTFDAGIASLVEDIADRGLDQDVSIVVWGGVRPHTEDQQECGPRPLGTGAIGVAGRRRNAGRPGDRLDRQIGRTGRHTSGALPGRAGDGVPQSGHQSA